METIQIRFNNNKTTYSYLLLNPKKAIDSLKPLKVVKGIVGQTKEYSVATLVSKREVALLPKQVYTGLMIQNNNWCMPVAIDDLDLHDLSYGIIPQRWYPEPLRTSSYFNDATKEILRRGAIIEHLKEELAEVERWTTRECSDGQPLLRQIRKRSCEQIREHELFIIELQRGYNCEIFL